MKHFLQTKGAAVCSIVLQKCRTSCRGIYRHVETKCHKPYLSRWVWVGYKASLGTHILAQIPAETLQTGMCRLTLLS